MLKKVVNILYLFLIIYNCCAVVSGITGSFKVESPSGEPIQGMELRHFPFDADLQNGAFVTDQEGKVNVTGFIPMHNFVIQGVMPSYDSNLETSTYQKLYIYGRSSSTDFYYTTYLGTRAEARLISKLIDTPYNASNGFIVVGMDIMEDPHMGLEPSNLEPAVGATSTLSGLEQGGKPFVFAPGIEIGSTIQPHGSSFVTYPNIVPGNGKVTVNYSPPSFSSGALSQCGVSPGFAESLSDSQPIEVFSDSISVVSYVCIEMSR